MGRLMLTAIIVATVLHGYGALQVQMPENAEFQQPEDGLETQIRQLQKNVTDIWTYIQDLRSAVSQHLTHLRTHQAELESSVHRMEHLHDDTHDSNTHGSLHGDSHHHSGEQHSHSGEHHSHGDGHDSHSHGSDSHSHGSDPHSHGSDSHSHGSDPHSHGSDSHSHGSDSHSHSGEHHSHSGEQHSHSGEHGHHSHSYSHSSHDHSKEDSGHSHSHDHGSMSSSSHSHSHDDHSHGSDHSHDHKDLHENEDVEQEIQQVASDTGPLVAEPIVTATTRQEHYHHHHDHSQSSRPSSGSSSNSMDLMNENTFHHHHHGHHHHPDSVSRSSRNRTVELPKYSDYDMYDFALCNVQPNRAIPEDQQQNIGGQVTLWQKKSGGPLNIHVRLQGFQMGDHHSHHGAHQAVQQEQDNETPQEDVGHKHGFHIHTSGDLSNGCQSTGPHFNPKGVNHGGPTSLVRHVGDLGNIECDSNGVTNSLFSDDIASLRGQYSIIGKAMVIHSKVDDLGQGGDDESLKTGNAGTRVACCVIQQVDKLPIRYYKVMKTASQYQNY